MDRRTFLATVTVLGAGCAGNRGREDTPDPTPTATPTATVTPTTTRTPTEPPTETPYQPEQTADHIEAARSDLETAVREFRTETSQIQYTFTSAPRFDAAPTEAALRDAQNELQAAEELATPQQQTTVAALRSYAEFLTSLVDTVDVYVESLDHRYRALIQEDNERYEAAIDRLERAQSSLDSARTQLEDARSLFEDLQADVEDPDSVAFTDAETSLQRISSLLTGFTTVYDGDLRIERGLMDYNDGIDDFNDEYYSIALSSFDSAESEFLRAENVFIDGESDAPTDLLDLILRRQCQSEKYATAAEEMGRACALAEGSPEEANEHIRSAEEALNRVC